MSEWIILQLETALASGSVMTYVLLFIGGVGASFTPCTYPVLPLTVGYIGNAAGGSKGRGLLLSLALVTGMAFVYAVAGVIVSAIGGQFGAIWANGWVVFAIAWFFIIMALVLMDVFTFPIPRFIQKLQGKSSNRKGIFGAFIVGGVSGLVVGPCTGPILGVVLTAVGSTIESAEGAAFIYQSLAGGAKLFVFGFGQGTLIILCGVFAGLLSRLPKSGMWMVKLKKFFAMLMLAGATLILVYAGQATDFPDLTRLIAGSTIEKTTEVPAQDFGGDEFLE